VKNSSFVFESVSYLCPSCRPTYSAKALKAMFSLLNTPTGIKTLGSIQLVLSFLSVCEFRAFSFIVVGLLVNTLSK